MRREKCIQGLDNKTQKERDHLEYPVMDGKIMIKWM
jgi:hypothetical protein